MAKNHLVRGCLFLSANIICWAFGDICSKFIYIWKKAYTKPILVTYLSTITYNFYWIMFLCQDKKKSDSNIGFWNRYKKEIKIALICGPLDFIGTIFFQFACFLTSVASVILLAECSTAFVALYGYLLIGIGFNLFKNNAIIFSIVGTVFIYLSDSSDESQRNPLLGDILVVLAMAIHGLSQVLLNKYVPDSDDEFNWSVFFGISGIIILIGWIPFIFLISWLQFEIFELPSFDNLLLIIFIGCLYNIFGDYSNCRSVVILGSLVTDLGTGLITPIIMVADIFLENKTYSLTFFIGFSLSIYCVLVILYDDFRSKKEEEEANIIILDEYNCKLIESEYNRRLILKI